MVVSASFCNDGRQLTIAKALSAPAFHRWLVPALGDWAAIVCAYALGFWLDQTVVWLAVIVLVGNRQHALGIMGHDGAHFAAARSKRLNDLASEVLCFWPLVTGLADFRRFHLNHHRYFNTDRDPELLFKNHWSRGQWQLPQSRAEIMGRFLLDMVGFGVYEVAKAYWLLGKTCARSWVGPACWWVVVGGLLYLAHLEFAIVIWFAALTTSFWGFFRLRTWIEHVGTDTTHRLRANWWQRLLITPHGSWSHYEHHDYPAVPFWRRHALRPSNAPTVTMQELFASFDARRSVPVERRRLAG